MGKGQPFQKMMLRKQNIHMEKNENGLLPFTIHNSQLKMGKT